MTDDDGDGEEGTKRKRGESGQYEVTYPADHFARAVRDLGGGSTNEVAQAVGEFDEHAQRGPPSYQLTYERLTELEEKGTITSRKVANARLWLPGEEGGT